MATEVGSAYVTLLPSARGFASRMQKELSGEIVRAGKTLGEDLGEEVGDKGGKEAATTFGQRLRANLGKIGALAGGAAIGGTLVKGISDALGAGDMTAKLTAQLGLTKTQSATAGKVAGNLFGQNYGDSMEQVNEAIQSVVQNIDGMRNASEATLGRISTKALNTANIFGQDLGGVTRAVSQLMRTGLAKNADEAFDILTKGFQSGADKSEDYLDTLNEYGTQFRKMGIDGATATGLISQGLRAGARDGDIVADAIKEFSIRAIDGSDATKAGFDAIGLSAEDMSRKIAAGGPGARKALSLTLEKLRGIKDPAERSAAAVNLFGTQAEDMGQALFKLDPSKAAKGLGQVKGAADKANAAFNDTPTARVQGFIRQLQQGLTNAMAKYVIPAIDSFTPILADLAPVLSNVTGAVKEVTGFLKDHTTTVKIVAAALGALVLVTQAHALAMALSTGAAKKWLLQTKLVQAATKAWAAIQWVLNAALNNNPIGRIVLVISALVGALIWAWKNSDRFRAIVTGAFEKVKDAASAVWNWFKSTWPLLLAILTGPIGLAVLAIVKNWDKIKAAGGVLVEWFKKLPGRIVAGLSALGGFIAGVFRGAWNRARNATVAVAGAIIGYVRSFPGRVLNGLGNLGNRLKNLFIAAWRLVDGVIDNARGRIVRAVTSIPGKLANLAGRFGDAGRAVIRAFVNGLKNAGGFVSDIAGNIWSAVKGMLNSAIGRINSALEFSVNTHIPGIGTVTINPPDIPKLAGGGRATAGTLAVIGEGREPETVLPDSMLRGLLERTAAGAAGGVQVGHLTITNWRDGTGYFRLVAEQTMADEGRFRRHVGAMNA